VNKADLRSHPDEQFFQLETVSVGRP
jgi:hypothetical protein